VFRPDPTGAFTVINVPFVNLLYGSYQLQPYQLIGAPSWVRDERYDVIAKFDPKFAGRLQPDGHPPTWALAVRRLLVERAQLTFHRETRQLPVYALVMARPDGKLGPNIRPVGRCGTRGKAVAVPTEHAHLRAMRTAQRAGPAHVWRIRLRGVPGSVEHSDGAGRHRPHRPLRHVGSARGVCADPGGRWRCRREPAGSLYRAAGAARAEARAQQRDGAGTGGGIGLASNA
jgi:hypothetical protein